MKGFQCVHQYIFNISAILKQYCDTDNHDQYDPVMKYSYRFISNLLKGQSATATLDVTKSYKQHLQELLNAKERSNMTSNT